MSTNSTTTTSQSYVSPSVTILLTIILLLLFSIGFFSIYFCRCFFDNLALTWNFLRSPSGSSVGRGAASATAHGLHPSIIKSFPTFAYSTVRDNYGLECAICLAEFQDDSVLRLLNGCYHVFHQECIDFWLEYHKTCPVCRRALDSLEKSTSLGNSDADEDVIVVEVDHDDEEEEEEEDEEYMDDTFSIDITSNENGDDGGGRNVVVPCGSARCLQERKMSNTNTSINNDAYKFPRSHSTGHSTSCRTSRGEEDRFALRLPEHVKVKIDTGGHNQTGSCIAFGEFSSGKTKTDDNAHGFGEASGSTAGQDVDNV